MADTAGCRGWEATVRESDGLTTPVQNDYFGNVLATISGGSASWNPVRLGGYGPVLGYRASALTLGAPMADTLVWRSRSIDPGGFYYLGARYYDPVAGHFRSPDPLAHAASMDLHNFGSGDARFSDYFDSIPAASGSIAPLVTGGAKANGNTTGGATQIGKKY